MVPTVVSVYLSNYSSIVTDSESSQHALNEIFSINKISCSRATKSLPIYMKKKAFNVEMSLNCSNLKFWGVPRGEELIKSGGQGSM